MNADNWLEIFGFLKCLREATSRRPLFGIIPCCELVPMALCELLTGRWMDLRVILVPVRASHRSVVLAE